MSFKQTIFTILSVLLFSTGVIMGLALLVMQVWPDLEATFYTFDRIADQSLPGFSCPPLLTTRDTGYIKTTINNPTDREIQPIVRASLSNPGPLIEEEVRVKLAPGEKRDLSWPITKENRDLRYFIFAHVFKFSTYGVPNQEDICGVLMLDAPWITGTGLYALLFGGNLLLTSAGIFLWHHTHRADTDRSSSAKGLLPLTIVIVLGLVISSFGNWLPGLLLLLLAILIIGAMLMNILGASFIR